MGRSIVTIDVGAVRANARRLRDVLDPSELWAVVKADGYGHGAAAVARAAVEGGATALCVATIDEALALRRTEREARILVMGPTDLTDSRRAREARLELVVNDGRLPQGVAVHLKLDTGMGRWGLSELPEPTADVVGLMTHFASADSDHAFTELQLERFLTATRDHARLCRHAANSAAALTIPTSRLDAARCGIALYGIDPFGVDATDHGLRAALRWESVVAQVKHLDRGESTGYGRRYVADLPTWIGLVPVGYADGFRRDLTGTSVLVGDTRGKVVGTVSMDVIAVQLERQVDVGTPVTLIGGGITVEEHARIADTIGYELVCGIRRDRAGTRTEVIG